MSTELAELKPALAAAAAADSQFPAGRFEGRGIVICAGGARLFTCAWVCNCPAAWQAGLHAAHRSVAFRAG